ncbi:hypothetical protein MKX01_038293 [Papaver californicum]|nr:hypothetical protein MKX01_038293 [Papaver californicum]
MKAMKGLKSRRHMDHRERRRPKPNLRCLIPIPKSYKMTLPWPKSRDMAYPYMHIHILGTSKIEEHKWMNMKGVDRPGTEAFLSGSAACVRQRGVQGWLSELHGINEDIANVLI